MGRVPKFDSLSSSVAGGRLSPSSVPARMNERSQAKNRARAESVLRSRLYELERERQQSEEAAARRSQVGSGDRAEKIRTYNFPQDRITDHRVSLTIHGMDRVMDGEIDQLIDAVSADEEARLLAAAS